MVENQEVMVMMVKLGERWVMDEVSSLAVLQLEGRLIALG